jgi:CBS domain-containing protein
MKTVNVSEVMVPLKNYATVPESATLYEAVVALEKAQKDFDQDRYRHRAVLVYDDNSKKIVGKISQMDILKALEPNYQIVDMKAMSRFGFSLDYFQSIAKKTFWDKPLRDICHKAATVKVRDFMYTPGEAEYIKESASLDEGIHQLIVGKHHSLLVTRDQDIVGVLRLTDVFVFVREQLKTCKF